MSTVAGMVSLRRAVIAATLLLSACRPTIADLYTALPAVGDPLPAFRYPALDGSILTAESLHGRPTVVVLWSTTCSASRLALTALDALASAFGPRGARVVVLADDRDPSAVASVLESTKVRIRVALAASTLQDTFTHGQSMLPWRKAFGLPSIIVVGADGRVTYRQVGVEQDEKDRLGRVREHLDGLLRRDGRDHARHGTTAAR